MDTEKQTEIDLRDSPGEVDLSDRLRFAAGSLAADFGETVTAEHAEALVFSSADVLLADASVTEFVPILAERRARLALRSTTMPPPSPRSAPTVAAATEPAAPRAGERGTVPPVSPLVSVPDWRLAELRETLEQVRDRVAGWRAELDRR
jgi:hypothetical protein